MKRLGLRVTNETAWNTKDLRRLAAACLRHRGAPLHKHFTFAYQRAGTRRLGCAELGRWLSSRQRGGLDVMGAIEAACGHHKSHFDHGYEVRINLPRPADADHVPGVGVVIGREALAEIARTIEHEVDHTLGLRHRDMVADTAEARPCAWAAGLLVVAVPEPKPEVPMLVLERTVAERKARAAELLSAWETRLRRAQAKVRKYRAKVRGYERRAAARAAKRGED